MVKALLEIFLDLGAQLNHVVGISEEVQVLPHSPATLDLLGVPPVQGPLQIVNGFDGRDFLAHQVVHDDHRDGLHELDLHCIYPVEAREQGIRVLLDVLVVPVQDALLREKLQLVFLERLYNELPICCVEEETIGLPRANLKLGHLLMIFSRSK